jgi:hypothetical protein
MPKIRPDFDIREFVPPGVWREFGEKSRWLLDPKMLDLAQFYRDFFGAPVYVNTWAVNWVDKNFTLRGFRPPQTTTGAHYSQHKFGRAFDCNVQKMTPDEVRGVIKDNSQKFMEEGLTTLESGEIATTWIHSDVRTTNQDDILIVTP